MRLIDVDDLGVGRCSRDVVPAAYCAGWNGLLGLIEKAPTVDAVVVTRCKDCEHAERYERTDGTAGYYCGHPQNTFVYGERWDRVFKPVKKPDDFCSYGERKEGAAHAAN